MNINSITVVVLRTNWRISQSKSKKNPKKIHPQKNSLYFQKWNLLALILKKLLHFVKRKLLLHFLKRKFFLYFLIFQEATSPPPPPSKNLYTWGNRNPKKLLKVQANVPFKPKAPPQKKNLMYCKAHIISTRPQ